MQISNHTNQQPRKHKVAATLINNHKLQNNYSLKKYISEHKCKNYVNLWVINGVLTLKNIFTAIKVV